eukprot:4659524-Pyramimonas_sp.AAC.1
MADAGCEIMPLVCSWRLGRVARETASKVQARLKGRSMTDQILGAEVWGLQQFMLGRDLACVFLADFAAAFPSVAISWPPRALVLIQVHPGVAGFLMHFTPRIWGISAAVGSGAEAFGSLV